MPETKIKTRGQQHWLGARIARRWSMRRVRYLIGPLLCAARASAVRCERAARRGALRATGVLDL